MEEAEYVCKKHPNLKHSEIIAKGFDYRCTLCGGRLERQEKISEDWTTLREQIIELWKSRDLEVLDIEVKPQSKGSWKWIISAKEKEGG